MTYEALLVYAFEAAKLIPICYIMGKAALQDLNNTTTFKTDKGETVKCGEVSNKLWLYAPIGLLLSLIEYWFLAPTFLIPMLTSIFVAIVMALALFYFNLWGGADTKALITIACAFPLTPTFALTPLTYAPMIILIISATLAAIYAAIRKRKHIRFLPWMFIGTLLTIIL